MPLATDSGVPIGHCASDEIAANAREPQGTDADEDTQRPKPVAAAANDDNNTGLKQIEEEKQLAADTHACHWTRIRKPQRQLATARRALISPDAM
jgi:hypothetical protein